MVFSKDVLKLDLAATATRLGEALKASLSKLKRRGLFRVEFSSLFRNY